MCIRPCAASGASQENALSMRIGVPSSSSSRSSGPCGSRAPCREQHGHAASSLCRRAADRRDRLRDTATCSARTAGVSTAPSSICSRWMRAAGVEAVGVGRNAAHRVHRDRPADHLLVPAPGVVGPGLVELDRLVEGDVGELARRCGGSSRRRRRSVPRPHRARIAPSR